MIEAYVLITLVGIGYVLNQLKDQEVIPTNIEDNIHPREKNIDNDKSVEFVKQVETDAAQKNYAKSIQPGTNVINRNHNLFVSSQLAGVDIPKEQFVHNNMVPFYRGSLKQDMKGDASGHILEAFGATPVVELQPKKEVESFFAPQKDIGNVNGYVPPLNDDLINRYKSGLTQKQNNVLPFTQDRVGPGLNAGYGDCGVGGFQQFDVVEIARSQFKTTNDLRVANKPKESYEGQVLQSGLKTIGGLPGKVGAVQKARPDTYYENTPDRYFKTTGAYTKPMQEPEVVDRYTTRIDTNSDYIAPGYNAKKGVNVTSDAAVRTPFKSTNEPFELAPAVAYQANKNQYCDDYGKANILVFTNERDVTSTRTHVGNLTTVIKSFTKPFEDVMKLSKKEYNVENPREFGNISITFPEKLTVKDPNDILRTTIKETLIHDSEVLNLKGPTKIKVNNPNDVARTTLKETLIHDASQTMANIRPAILKPIVYNPDEVAKTTIRETLENAEYTRNVQGLTKKSIVYNPNSVARTTIKETTNAERAGNVGGSVSRENKGYEVANFVVPPTQKAELADIERYGGVDNIIGGGKGYETAKFEMKPTEKENPEEYFGIAGDVTHKENMSYDDIYNARIDAGMKDSLNVTHQPTPQGVKVATGSDGINVDIKKLNGDIMAQRENLNLNPRINTVDTCIQGATKGRQDYKSEDRLDTAILNQLASNPYAISIT